MRLAQCTAIAVAVACMSAFDISAEDAWPELDECRVMKDGHARLACYDLAYDLRRGRAPPAVTGDQEAATLDRFGYEDVREREERRAARRGERLAELVGTVTEVRRRRNGAHVLTLDNGQVWSERGLDAGFRVAVGDRVRIRPAAMGSYLLVTPHNRSARVTRLH